MKIDFSTRLKSINGNDLDDGTIDLRTVSVMGLLDEAKGVSGVELVRRHRLAQRILLSDAALDIPPEDTALIKERVATKYPLPAIVGPAWALLDG